MKKMRGNGAFARVMAVLLAMFVCSATVRATTFVVCAEEVTDMSPQNATIKGDGVRARTGAGTSHDIAADNLASGTAVTVTGQASDPEGKVWYQVTLSDGKTAFVRNDFLELGDVIEQEPVQETEPEPVEPAEPEPAEPAETPTPIVSSQYVAVYEEDDQGTYYWYLHDNDEGYRVKIDDLLAAARSVDDVDAIEKQNKTLKTVLVVLAILLVVLLVIMVILIFRLRDYMYYEEDEEEEEEEPRRSSGGSFVKRRRDEDLIEEEPVRQSRTSKSDAGRARPRGDYGDEQPREARAGRGTAGSSRGGSRETVQRPRESEQTRRARNVMRDDDDLEYEFLNLDDEK
ncbi:MAG: SH3 domain-containing protein [Lachnospiraceae bacterium]|nr:SH3 domain-containing protein [Lachnospiraceae bacterium]